jgi:hypothetical protein
MGNKSFTIIISANVFLNKSQIIILVIMTLNLYLIDY